ncbi:hypothetical protein JXM67_06065 [candidate division WOR-3 bacterium]|nr:hypothetical protein [candidate division WOR-3 bacterium]
MKKRWVLFILAVFLIIGTACDNQRQLREILAARTFELGYIEGEIFTLTLAIRGLIDTSSFKHTDLDEEVRHKWDDIDKHTMIEVCDSLGIVFDDVLSNSLLLIYREAYLLGITEGVNVAEVELFGKPDTLTKIDVDSTLVDHHDNLSFEEAGELAKAKAAYEEVKSDMLLMIESVELTEVGSVKP